MKYKDLKVQNYQINFINEKLRSQLAETQAMLNKARHLLNQKVLINEV